MKILFILMMLGCNLFSVNVPVENNKSNNEDIPCYNNYYNSMADDFENLPVTTEEFDVITLK